VFDAGRVTARADPLRCVSRAHPRGGFKRSGSGSPWGKPVSDAGRVTARLTLAASRGPIPGGNERITLGPPWGKSCSTLDALGLGLTRFATSRGPGGFPGGPHGEGVIPRQGSQEGPSVGGISSPEGRFLPSGGDSFRRRSGQAARRSEAGHPPTRVEFPDVGVEEITLGPPGGNRVGRAGRPRRVPYGRGLSGRTTTSLTL
jgi:hypothetical protein